MNGILDAAIEVDGRLQQADLEYCLIGGIALQRWGEPRTTLDVDVTVMTDFGDEAAVIKRILPLFQQRVADAFDFALQSRVLLLKTDQGVGIDISLGALPFESGVTGNPRVSKPGWWGCSRGAGHDVDGLSRFLSPSANSETHANAGSGTPRGR